MKKFLLPILMFFLTATGASAQSLSLTSKTFAPTQIAKPSLSACKQALKAPQKADEQNLYLAGYDGSDGAAGIGRAGLAKWEKANMILSSLPSDQVKVGHKIVGLRFCVASSLGANAAVLAAVFDSSQLTEMPSAYIVDESGNDIYNITEFPNEDGAQINIQWNQYAFDKEYDITGNEAEILYGYMYTQSKTGTQEEQNPIMFGVSTSDEYENMFLVSGQPSTSQKESIYYISSADQPYVPCFQLIMEDPSGETYIAGQKGSDKPVVAKEYFSVDGARLSAPQKGLNIVKMSDGTTKKVVVK